MILARRAFKERQGVNGAAPRWFSADEAKGWIEGYAEALVDGFEYTKDLEAAQVMLEAKAMVMIQCLADVVKGLAPEPASGDSTARLKAIDCCMHTLRKVAGNQSFKSEETGE